MAICDIYQDYPEDEVNCIKNMVKSGFFRKTQEERMAMLNMAYAELCGIHDLPAGSVLLLPGFPGVGMYDPEDYRIAVDKPSVVTFLHEFRHHMQLNAPTARGVEQEASRHQLSMAEDAQAWATGLYRKACPKLFEKAVRNGRIMGLTWAPDGEVVDA